MAAPATDATVLTRWAQVLVRSLVEAGIDQIVVAPGARSSPFVHAAHQQQGLRLWCLHDERSAGFFALGRVRVTGSAVAILCTSGTAGAHLYPAVIEAALDELPLVVVTADRPPELHECGAAQTIDQQRLFGIFCRTFTCLGTPEAMGDRFRALRHQVARAVTTAHGVPAGPVHLNAPARKPLAPVQRAAGTSGFDDEIDALEREPLPRAYLPSQQVSREVVEQLAQRISGQRGWIVCGSTRERNAPAIAALARVSGYPVIAEATSQLRYCLESAAFVHGIDGLCRSGNIEASDLPPLLVHIGRPLLSAAWSRCLRARRPEQVVISSNRWDDPEHTVGTWVHGEIEATLRAVVDARAGLGAPRPAEAVIGELERSWWARIAGSYGGTALSEGLAVRTLCEALHAGDHLWVGNSLSIRNLELHGAPRAITVQVLCQRGANGIDGMIAGALGIASFAHTPTFALIGDITFLHDVSSLAAAQHARSPLVLVVMNNHGGRIFEQLPALGDDPQRRASWTTPHDRSCAAIALAYGVPAVIARSRDELFDHLTSARQRPGLSVIEVLPQISAHDEFDRLSAPAAPFLDAPAAEPPES